MKTSRETFLAVALVALMLAVPFTVIGGQDESDAAETNWPAMSDYSYKVTYSTSSTALTVEKQLSTSADVTSWNTTTGVGPFNMFYAAISTGATDANALSNTPGHIAYILNPNNLTQAVKYSGSDSTFDISGVIANYNIMLVIPTVYWGVSGSAYYLTNVPSDTSNNGISFAPYAHMVDGKDIYPYLAIGVYEATVVANKGLMSQTGSTPTVSKTIDGFRAHVYEANSLITDGVGTYQMWNFYEWTLYKLLAETYVGSFDSSAAAGGRINQSAIGSNGLGDSAGPVSPSSASEYGKILIENAWGNVWEFVDNTYVASGVLKAGSALGCTLSSSNPSVEGQDYTGGAVAMPTSTSGQQIATIQTAAAYFGMPLTTQTGGTAGTMVPDGCWFNNGQNSVLSVGGCWYNAAAAGLSAWNSDRALSSSSTNFGARLAYLMSADAADAEPTCTITYRAMDGAAIAGTAATTAREGVAHTLPAAPTGAGSFLGWYTAPAYGDYAGAASGSYTPASSMSLYAIFEPYTETLNFYEWEGTAYGTVASLTVPGLADSNVSYMPTSLTSTVTAGGSSYKFVGWTATAPTDTSVIGTGTFDYAAGNPYVTSIASTATDDVTTSMYAIYVDVTASSTDPVTITFMDSTPAAIADTFIAPGYTTDASGQINYPSGQSLRLPGYSAAGEVFLGWYTAATSGNLVGNEGDVVALNAAATLYARTATAVTISFVDEDDQAIASETITSYEGAYVSLPNYVAADEGSVLRGWIDSEDTADEPTILGTYGSKYAVPSADITLKAVSMQLSSGGSADLSVYAVSAGSLTIGGAASASAISDIFTMTLPEQILPGTHGLIKIVANAGQAYKVNSLTVADDPSVEGTGTAVLVQIDQFRWMIQSVTGAVVINVDASAVAASDYGYSEFYIAGLTGTTSAANTGAVVKLVGGDYGLAAGNVGIRGTYVISTTDDTTGVVTRTYGAFSETSLGTISAGDAEYTGTYTLDIDGAYIYCVSGIYSGTGFSVESPMVLAPRAA